jgi:Dolichyl-phosphate-mannose-protein mannosyltransferase
MVVAAVAAVAAWLDANYRWIDPVFDAVAHQFYEIPVLARIRRPSQLVLVRCHLAIGTAVLVACLGAAPWLNRHGRAFVMILGIGYALRAIIWICGGNLPLVPGDSCHYLEVANSVLRGEGPVKHYVESFFTEYRRILEGRGVLDDWATPLDAYVRALAWWITGLGPDASLDSRIAVAKSCSFLLNLLALPALYGFAWRRFGSHVALWSMAVLAILPAHAIYAGFVLRESLVALISILAVWTLTEIWSPDTRGRAVWIWAIAAGLCGGLAVLSRTTGMAILAASGLFALVTHGRTRLGPLFLWGLIVVAVILPWAWATMREYGTPFYSYTSYFEYNFSWTIHHYQKGNTRAAEFYTSANMPEIMRVKIKAILIIVVYSTMIVGLPVVLGFCRHLCTRGARGRETDFLVATIIVVFVLATLKTVADVTQVAQLGRYYLPVYALALPSAVAGLIEWRDAWRINSRVVAWLCASFCALVWADPTWAYDASWLVKPFQFHWPALREAGNYIQTHPDQVPPEARIMTWFPWELRVTSDRTTILMPRNYDPRRINEVIKQYRVTHILWGSFEPPPDVDPETWGPFLERVRSNLGLTDDRELFGTARGSLYPVRLYRLK